MKLLNLRQIGFLLLLILLIGCSSINVNKMITEQTSFGIHYPATVALETSTQSKGINYRSVTIPPEAFQEAIKLSLEKSALFKSIVDENIADYVLKSELIFSGVNPGASMTAWVDVDWSLNDRASGKNVWNNRISTEGHVGAFEAFAGWTRAYIALERGAQKNINQALNQIKELEINAP